MIDIGPGVVLEALEVGALVYLMWVVGELGAALREHLGSDMERSRCDNERCPRRPNGEG